MAVTKEIIECFRPRLTSGEDPEGLVRYLRKSGLSKVETIKALVDMNVVSLPEAKRLVHLSATWKDAYHRDEKLHDMIEQSAKDPGVSGG